MKPLIILSLFVMLCGAGCKKAPEVRATLHQCTPLELQTDELCIRLRKEVEADNLRDLEAKKQKPIMVTVKLKTPIKTWCPAYDAPNGCTEEYKTETTTQIPLQEFVDLLDFKYVPATSTTSNQPAKLVK
ncbi:MAG TPA: hypothetical protein PLI01_00475 [Nitrospira sp.]|nr:hypothetical protein [Nitrospira sp.]HNA25234.1 hypothetical protein [Nitrospira sp.]HNI17524.1 hypothetical protein [Nitrospira sp.]